MSEEKSNNIRSSLPFATTRVVDERSFIFTLIIIRVGEEEDEVLFDSYDQKIFKYLKKS